MIWLAILVVVSYVSVPQKHRIRARAQRSTPRAKAPKLEMGALVTEVSTRLRSGASAERAWAQTLQAAGFVASGDILDADGVPRALREAAELPARQRKRRGISDVVIHSLPATFAVCKMSYRTGAPMAEVLEACAAGITEAGEARSAREVALAGPQTSARMLAVLPFMGIFLGYALGANPLQFLLSTPLGIACLVAGVAFEASGLVWTSRMVAAARRAEGE